MDLLKNFLHNIRGAQPRKTTVPDEERPEPVWKRVLQFVPGISFILVVALVVNRWFGLVEVPGWLDGATFVLAIAGVFIQLLLHENGEKEGPDKDWEGRRERVHARAERKHREKEAPDDLLTYGSDDYRKDDGEPR